MGLILCMAGAAGALVSVLAIAVLSLMGKKAGVPLGLFALCAAVMLASGLLPGGSGTERPPRSPGEIRGTPVTSAVRPAARAPEPGEDPEPVRDPESGEPAGSALPAADIPAVDIPETEASASAGEMAAVLESILRESYTGCQVTSENGDITADIWSDGLGDAVAAIREAGGSFADESWMMAKDAVVLMSRSFRGLMDEAGLEESVLTVNVLNDLNREKALLSVRDSTIVYDTLA